MKLDIRLPVGLLFSVLGLLLIVYGFTSDPAIYRRSLGINVNLDWGAVMLLFGVCMLGLARAGRNAPPEPPDSDE